MAPSGYPVGEPVGVASDPEPQPPSPEATSPHEKAGQAVRLPMASEQKGLVNSSSLDGLRGLAVMHIVLGHHAAFTDWSGVPDDGFSDGVDLMGGASMGLFYILSGFVLMAGYGGPTAGPAPCAPCCDCFYDCCSCFCGPPEEGGVKRFDSRAFYWKRFARLGPLWYLGNLLALPLFLEPAISKGDLFEHWGWWVGAGLALPPIGLNSWSVLFFPPAGHLWTVSTMAFFYLLFPALMPRVRRLQPEKLRCFALTMYGIQCAAMIGAHSLAEFVLEMEGMGYWFARAYPPVRLPVFVMGMVAARQCELQAAEPRLRQSCSCDCTGKGYFFTFVVACAVLVGLAEQLVLIWSGGFFTRFFGEVFLPVAFYEIVVALAYPASLSQPPSRMHAILGSRPMRRLADISLAVYILHQTLITAVAMAFGAWDGLHWRMPNWAVAATLPLSLLLGWALTYLFERPAKRLILKGTLRGDASPTASNASSSP